MILIADSGSNKTDWALLGDDGLVIDEFHTRGFNPRLMDTQTIAELLRLALPNDLEREQIKSIWYYGAGCSSDLICNRMSEVLAQIFSNAKVFVSHDLLGTARALCGNEPGMVAILGTGSNACFYDGKEIKEYRGGEGYIISDEGSGTHMGKKLLQHYLYKELPEEVKKHFDNTFNTNRDEILYNIYQAPEANKYLAAFAPFIHEHKEHPFIKEMIREVLDDFAARHLIKFKNCYEVPVHAVGSIASHFEKELRQALMQRRLQSGNITQKPIKGLVVYHQERGQEN